MSNPRSASTITPEHRQAGAPTGPSIAAALLGAAHRHDMPVSTFSSGQNRSHGAMLARWSLAMERMSLDERRTSKGEIAEMDGTGLHERDDWPLAPPRPATASPDPFKPTADHSRSMSAGSNAIPGGDTLPQMEGIHPDQVEGVDEEGDVAHEEQEQGEDADDDVGHKDESRVQGHRDRALAALDEHASNRTAITQSEPSRFLYTHLDGRTSESVLQRGDLDLPPRSNNVSPALEDNGAAISNADSGEHSRRPSIFSASDEEQREESDPRSYVQSEMARASPSEASPVHVERAVLPPSLGQRRASVSSADESSPNVSTSSLSRDGDNLPSEHRDALDAAQQTLPQPNPGPPLLNGLMLPPNNHVRQNSTYKGSLTPQSRNLSRRGSQNSTTFMPPPNKERVRYSWQSVQDDEPNHPRIHIIKLMSETATASAGFPGGEAFAFSISPSGRRIAAYNSARLFVLQTAALPVGISQDYALRRRPLAVEIVDDGSTLAILADEHTVNIYDLNVHRLRRRRTIKLDYPTTCIALSRTGGLLAAAYEGGIEIFSLEINALATDRRAVRCVRMDKMTFSDDGSTLLGTTTRINTSATVIVSVPLFTSSEDGIPTHGELKEAWCSELLHPENIRNSSHATFMREDRETSNDRLFAWNGVADTFGILNTSDLTYGNIDFPVVISPPLSSCGGLGAAIHSCPAVDEHGDTVAMIVNGRTVRLYIVPHKAEDQETTVEAHSIDHELDDGYGCPFSEVKWVHSRSRMPAPSDRRDAVKGRLIVTSPGGVIEPVLPEDVVPDIEGGRIIMFDFDPQFADQPHQTFSLTLGKSPPQMLEEEEVDPVQEVALVRRRTVTQSKSGSLSQRPITLGRAATTFPGRSGRAAPNVPPSAYANRRSVMSIASFQSNETSRSLPDLLEQNESADIGVEEPFSNTAPRATSTLQRAATNLQRHRFQTLEERQQERVSIDSNGNFLPLPEYTEEPNAPLPSKYRALAGLDAPKQYPLRQAVATNSADTGSAKAATEALVAAPGGAEAVNSDGAHSHRFPAIVTVQGVPSGAESTIPETPLFSPVVPGAGRNAIMATLVSGDGGTFSSEAAPSSPTSRTPTRDAQWMAAIAQDAALTGPRFTPLTPSAAAQLPRSLQRAYSNAIAQGKPPSIIGDWENVTPIGSSSTRPTSGPTNRASVLTPPPNTSSEAWDAISPVASHSSRGYSGFQRHSANSSYQSGFPTPNHRTSSSTYSHPMSDSDATMSSSSSARRMPPHMRAFRNQASLFPPAQATDLVPLPRHKQQKVGSVAHPITAWHPPAPSTNAPTTSQSARSHTRTHSRQSSISRKTAFASTEKARSMGFFRRRGRSLENGTLGSSASIMTGRTGKSNFSKFTRGTQSDRDCVVM